jgi:hypothetical protein
MRKRKARFYFAGVTLVFAALLMAGRGGAVEVSAKRELALELLRVAGGGNMARQFSQVMLSSMRQSYSAMVNQLLSSQPNLTPDQRRAIEQRLANIDRFSERFTARMNQEIDFEAVLSQVYVPLYEKYFTESELREILAFQSSAVGQKSISIMPQLMQEGMAATLPVLQPTITKIAGEILREEQAIALGDMR